MDRYRVQPGTTINLGEWNPDDDSLFRLIKKEGRKRLKALNKELEALQETPFAEGKREGTIVLQAMDTGGKDGCIRHVFSHIDPQGIHVRSFKKPSEEELSYDFLWRVHKHTPARGEMVIFNRSHYEDVLAVRVLNLVPTGVAKAV